MTAGSNRLPNLTVQQLEYLLAVSRAPTFAAAAEGLGVSPSALSQGLAELERRIGMSLFERSGRRRVLTPTAATVVAHAERVIAQTRDLARWLGAAARGLAGVVRIGMIDVASVDHFGPLLGRFIGDRPTLDLRLVVAPSAELLERLDAGSLDLVVCVRPSEVPESLTAETLRCEPLAVYGPPGTSLSTPADRWGPWLTFPEGSHTRSLVMRALAARGATPEVVAESHQPDVLRAMVRLGLGWTVLPVVQAEREPDPLQPVDAGPLVHRDLIAVRRSAALPDPAVEALLTELRASSATTG
jgi:DNA-binding transcriptional LysR family regulator